MFGIGSTELLVIAIVALIVVGPQNLPKIAHTIGKAFGEFKRASTEIQRALNTEIAIEETKQKKSASENSKEGPAQSSDKDDAAGGAA